MHGSRLPPAWMQLAIFGGAAAMIVLTTEDSREKAEKVRAAWGPRVQLGKAWPQSHHVGLLSWIRVALFSEEVAQGCESYCSCADCREVGLRTTWGGG